MENNIVIFSIVSTLLLIVFTTFIVKFFVVQGNKHKIHEQEKENLLLNYNNELLKVKLEVHEIAMKEIAREIHDNISQLLRLAKMNMYVIEENARGKKNMELVSSTKEMVEQIVLEIDNISHFFDSDYVKNMDIVEVFQKEAEYINHSKRMQCEIEFKGDFNAIKPEKSLIVFRIAQEAIQNIIKHSKATMLNIRLENLPGSFVLSVSDNGIGFDTKTKSKGSGLKNMEFRASMVKGDIQIKSEPSKGTEVLLTVASPENINS